MVLAALEAGPCPFPPPKSGCFLAALSSSRAVLRVRDRTSSSCLRSAWTESNSMWRAWIFSELLQNQKDQNKMVFLKTKKKGQKKSFAGIQSVTRPAWNFPTCHSYECEWDFGITSSLPSRRHSACCTLIPAAPAHAESQWRGGLKRSKVVIS